MSKIELSIELNRTVTVNFDENYGELIGTTVRKEVTHNSTYGTLPQAQREGRGFAGWYTATIEGQKITGLTSVTQLNEHTLYARWTCEVTFNPNGGECSELSRTVVEGNKYGELEQLPEPTRIGYTFNGWYYTEHGGGSESVDDIDTVPSRGNHTLYAHWTPETYMLTFDANGGTCSTSDQSIIYDSPYGTLPTPTKLGCEFIGWFTEQEGGTEVTEATLVDNPDSHTLYAHWNRNSSALEYCSRFAGEYEGIHSGDEAYNLLLEVKENNEQNETKISFIYYKASSMLGWGAYADPDHSWHYQYDEMITKISGILQSDKEHTFRVEVEKDDSTGFINCITVIDLNR